MQEKSSSTWSFEHLTCETDATPDARSINIRRTVLPKRMRNWAFVVGLQGLACLAVLVNLRRDRDWAQTQEGRALLAPYVATYVLISIVATLGTLMYIMGRAAELSTTHPTLQKQLTLRWRELRAYREDADASIEALVDGRAVFHGGIRGIAVTFDGLAGQASVLRIHLVFRELAVELDAAVVSKMPEAAMFVGGLTGFLDCSVYTGAPFRSRPPAGVVIVWVLSLVFLFVEVTILGDHPFASYCLLMASPVLNLLVGTWGVRRFALERAGAHEGFMREFEAELQNDRTGKT